MNMQVLFLCTLPMIMLMVVDVWAESIRKIFVKDPIVGSGRGKMCQTDRDCIPNAMCESNKECYCNLGYVPVQGDNFVECLKEASTPGDECSHHLQCTAAFGSLAECQTTSSSFAVIHEPVRGQCTCRERSHFYQSSCHKTSYIGERCASNDNCKILSTSVMAHCSESVCICPPHYKPNHENNDCLASAGLLESCDTDFNCIVPNSVCHGWCKCKIGYVMVPGNETTMCLQAVDELEWQCEHDNQCSEFLRLSFCHPRRKRCTCEPGAHAVHGTCYSSAGLGQFCSHPYECWKEEVNLTSPTFQCYQGKCKCAPNFVQRNQTCVPGRGVTLPVPMLLIILIGCLFVR